MAKIFAVIGYAVTEETKIDGEATGVWVEKISERGYYAELIRNTRRLQSGSSLNDDISISNEISIIADPYACANFHNIRYVVFMGNKWKVSDVTVQYPRLTLSIGGLYNE